MRLEDVSRETRDVLELFVELLLSASHEQNLIAPSTRENVWQRHVADSLQLLSHAPDGPWLDIGSGAGLPGLVVAIARRRWPVTLLEPRAKRAQFLSYAVERLALHHVSVVASRAETAPAANADIISARAVAPLSELLAIGARHAAPSCTWLLPKGRVAAEEVAAARRTWQGSFVLIPSLTDPSASIVVARDVRRIGA